MKVTLNVDKIFHLSGKLSITKQTLFKQSILFSFKTITFIESIIQNYPFKEILNATRSKISYNKFLLTIYESNTERRQNIPSQ